MLFSAAHPPCGNDGADDVQAGGEPERHHGGKQSGEVGTKNDTMY